jgi:hypothetical protein
VGALAIVLAAGAAPVWAADDGADGSSGSSAAAASDLRIVRFAKRKVTRRSATIAWTLSHAGSGRIELGKSTGYARTAASRQDIGRSHVVRLKGLRPGTRYHYRVVSTDELGNVVRSKDHTLVTTARGTRTADGLRVVRKSRDESGSNRQRTSTGGGGGARAAFAPAASQTVPSSIDRSGKTNVSNALNAFIAKVPNGSTINFPSGATYLLGGNGIRVDGRSNLIFAGSGVTLKITGCSQADAGFAVGYSKASTGITIRGFTILGDNGGTYKGGCEGAHGIYVGRSKNVEIANVTVRKTFGDGVYITDSSTGTWSDGVHIHDSRFESNGRMGIAIVGGRNVTIEDSTVDRSGIHAFDIEPNNAKGGAANVTIRDNTVGTYGICKCFGYSFFAVTAMRDVNLVNISNLVVENNRVTGGSIKSKVMGGTSRRWKNVTIRNNRGSVSMSGPAIRITNVDGVTVTGNVQPLSSGKMTSITGSLKVSSQ